LFDEPREIRRESLLFTRNTRENALQLLHQMELEDLKEWRSATSHQATEAEGLLVKLLELTTAIANGLQNTG
jgi:phosphoenolpyruvate carboxylase